jgi:O-antigen ligase
LLFFLKLLLTSGKNDDLKCFVAGDSPNSSAIEPTTKHPRAANESPLAKWITPTIVAYAIPMLGFSAFQHFLKIPDPFLGVFLSSPYEDIHSLGAIAATIYVALVSALKLKRPTILTIQLLSTGAILFLLISTWSRATWLATAIGIFILISIRLNSKWISAASLSVIIIFAAGNKSAKTGGVWSENIYLSRLHSLIKAESIAEKSSYRIELYQKALSMIKKEPVTGYGIGSFYLISPVFAPTSDPIALDSIARDYIIYLRKQPSFAHNSILQFTAELGIPATLLFCSLIGAAWHKGYRLTRAALKVKNGDLVPLALFLALTTYLITQMTANSLNLYVSHQFLFWFLIAALLTLPDSKTENQPKAIG